MYAQYTFQPSSNAPLVYTQPSWMSAPVPRTASAFTSSPAGGGEVERGRRGVRGAVRADAAVAPWLGEHPVEAVRAVLELVDERMPRRLAAGAAAHLLHDDRIAALDGVERVQQQHADDEAPTSGRRASGHERRERARAVGQVDVRREVDAVAHLDRHGNAQRLLVLDLEACTRCDECTKACSDTHDGITRLIRDGLRIDKWLVASSCRSCSDPYCLVGCPVDAIHRDGQGKQIQIESHCIGCGLCANNCPYGNINMHPRPKGRRAAAHRHDLRPLQLDRRPRQLAASELRLRLPPQRRVPHDRR